MVIIFIHALEDLLHSLTITDCHFSSVRIPGVETDLVRSDLFGSFLIVWKLDHLTGQLVDGSDNLQHLIFGDIPVSVDIIYTEDPWKIKERQHRLEEARVTTTCGHRRVAFLRGAPQGNAVAKRIRTLELVIRIASQGEGEGADELPEVDSAVSVTVKNIED